MIGKLKGLVDTYGDDFVILDVGGVGYVVFCSSRTLQALPPQGEAAVLFIETYVREDQIKLFGFASNSEHEWFKILLNVQGVGTKVALALLSTFKVGEMASAIALKDVASITRTPGVGKKLAERIVLDLKDKAPAFGSVNPAVMKLQGEVEDAGCDFCFGQSWLSANSGIRRCCCRHENCWRSTQN
jgi:holliday junction DNA helicase RuvA